MSHVITAVYEHGALHPVTPLNLQEHQRVQVHIIQEDSQETIEQILEWLTRIGRLSPPQYSEAIAPVSETERAKLAQTLGEAISTPLSHVILDERGEW